MIMDAVAKDAATKAMLRLPLNVTAFVPTDTVRAKPGISKQQHPALALEFLQAKHCVTLSPYFTVAAFIHTNTASSHKHPSQLMWLTCLNCLLLLLLPPQAFAKAAAKFGLGNDTSKLMANTCLLNALLKYHIMSPGMTQAKLATITSKNSMLVVSSTVNGAKKTTAKVLKFKVE